MSDSIAAPPIEVQCWRCGRKIFELKLEAGRQIPPGVVVERKCEKCKAMNHIPLDKLAQAAHNGSNRITE